MFQQFRIVPDTTPCQIDELMVLQGTYIQEVPIPYPFLQRGGIHPNDYSLDLQDRQQIAFRE